MSSSSRSDNKGRSSYGEAPRPRVCPSLPEKVYETKGKLVLLQEFSQAGVVEIKFGDGRLAYCFFQVVSLADAFIK